MSSRSATPATPASTPFPLRDEERTRCEVWTRVMGYHRPVSAFNAGKRSEHQERRHFVEPGCNQAPERP